MTIHLLRMAAGVDNLDDLHAIVKRETRNIKGLGPAVSIYTRNTPKRTADLLEGGSVFNIMRSKIQCRRRILDIRQAKDADGTVYCKIFLDPTLIRVMPVAHKPFQGWRYLEPAKAPRDLGAYLAGGEAPPEEMAEELRAMGLL